jgi:hypothetical protein
MLSSWRMYEMHLALFLKAGCYRRYQTMLIIIGSKCSRGEEYLAIQAVVVYHVFHLLDHSSILQSDSSTR